MINQKYKNMYNGFVKHYRKVHVNPWHEISEYDLEKIYDNLTTSIDVIDEYTFKYFMNYIIKRLSGINDAHTKYEPVSLIPINFKIFGSEILINYPQSLKNNKLIAINGIKIGIIIQELEDVIIYGTPGKRKYELEKALFNRYTLFGLPSLRKFDELIFEIEDSTGQIIRKIFAKKDHYSKEELFDYDEYRYGQNATYSFIDNVLIYNHSSVQMRFKDKIEQAINNLRKEDLTNISTIIIDIRGNTGGNSGLNKILMDFLLEYKDKELICLTDYRVFSGGRYALRDLINLGAITIGEEISTPINCYGNSNYIELAGHYFSVSECYFHPFMGWSASSKEEFRREATDDLLRPYIFSPDILIEEKKEDYMQDIDTILDYAIEYSKAKTQSK